MNITFTEDEKIDLLEGCGYAIAQELQTYQVDRRRFGVEEESMHVVMVYKKDGERAAKLVERPPHRTYYLDQVFAEVLKRGILKFFQKKSNQPLAF